MLPRKNPTPEQIKKAIEILTNNLADIKTEVDELVANPYRTEEENEYLKTLGETIIELVDEINGYIAYLENHLLTMADAIYFNLKRLAEEGDPVLKKEYERIRPLFEESIKERLGDGLS